MTGADKVVEATGTPLKYIDKAPLVASKLKATWLHVS